MARTTPIIAQGEPDYPIQHEERKRAFGWHHLALLGITLISVFLDFFLLGKNGFGSYYPPAVRSMMDSWHNFFFASYDPGGFVTIDKPPVGFWLEVASAKIFGFNTVSILLPQALAGVLSVLLLYYLVRRHFGIVAGLLAALALAVSPISVVTNRNETIDSTLALTLLVGAWAVIRAAETGKLRWLLLSAFIVGIGFNIKMMEAYLVVPAYGLLYLLAAPGNVWKRIGHLALATLVLLVVSFSWITAVDLTPASQRPYVGSTQDNSELSLALGYNGIERLFGRFGGGGAGFGGGTGGTRRTGTGTNRFGTGGTGTSSNGTTRTGGTNGFPGGNRNGNSQQAGFGGIFNTGTASPFRLFNVALGSQIGWLLPLALLGMIALALQHTFRQQGKFSWQRKFSWRDFWHNFQEDNKQKSLLFWGMWLLTMGIFFSVAGFFHQYYMTEMAPAVAALSGIGIVTMWQDYREGGWRGWLLPIALLLTLAEQVYLLIAYPEWASWMVPLIAVLTGIAIVVLVAGRILPRLHLDVRFNLPRFLVPALSVGVLALLIAPTVWALIPIFTSTQADTLVAGPTQGGGFGGGFGGREAATPTYNKLISYLEANQGNAKFLVAVPSSMVADTLILDTNKPIMSLGGFSGSDPILTTSQLSSLVSQGTVRFFLINSFNIRQIPPQILDQLPPQARQALQNGGGGFGGFGQQSALTSWVTQHCSTVPAAQWQAPSTSSTGNGFSRNAATQLYDCATTH